MEIPLPKELQECKFVAHPHKKEEVYIFLLSLLETKRRYRFDELRRLVNERLNNVGCTRENFERSDWHSLFLFSGFSYVVENEVIYYFNLFS